VSADYRVTAAREFLDAITPYPVASRPHSVLQREDAELRRILGQLLTYVDDTEDEERQHDVTGLTVSGGARISPAGMLILASALPDAAEYREGRAGDSFCADCEAAPEGLCETHSAELDQRDVYVALGRDLGIEVGA
jgi:hypothetical protein